MGVKAEAKRLKKELCRAQLYLEQTLKANTKLNSKLKVDITTESNY